jgi:hypothetical protein
MHRGGRALGYNTGLTKKDALSRVGAGDDKSFTRFSKPSQSFLISPVGRVDWTNFEPVFGGFDGNSTP